MKHRRFPVNITIYYYNRCTIRIYSCIHNGCACHVFSITYISELLGLKWSDVDWLNKTVRIERGVVKQIVEDVKTNCSARTMVCADELLEVLKQWRQATQVSDRTIGCLLAPFN